MREISSFLNEELNSNTLNNKKINEEKVQTYQGKAAKIKWAVDEPQDNDAENDVDMNSEQFTDSMEDLIDKFEVEEPFFIEGRAGWGKTSTIKKLAHKYGKEVITVYLDKAEAVDLGGIPVPVQGKTKIVAKAKDLATGKVEEKEFAEQMKALPPWAAMMLKNPNQEYLLFFDEMNQAAPDVMNALMPIVLDNVICEIQFDNFFVGAAGNFEEENGAVNALSGPLKSRFKPIITWEAGTPAAWKQVFRYLHKKWDNVLGEELVSKFEENAESFENPREIEHKVFQYAHRMKVNGGNRNDARKIARRLKGLAKEDLTRTQEKDLEKLADEMFNFIAGNTGDKKSGRRGKDSQQVPDSVKDMVYSGMKDGYFTLDIEDEKGNTKKVKFGLSQDIVNEIIDEDECNGEMLERLINKYEADGISWKYTEAQDWSKLKLEDPMADKWQFKINKKSKVVPNEEPQAPKKRTFKKE